MNVESKALVEASKEILIKTTCKIPGCYSYGNTLIHPRMLSERGVESMTSFFYSQAWKIYLPYHKVPLSNTFIFCISQKGHASK